MKAHLIGHFSPAARADLLAWVKTQDLGDVTKSNYVRGRTEKWYRLGSNLQSIPCGRAALFAAPEPSERLAAFGDRNRPGWHSLLVCGGSTTIGPHRDHGHFEAEAVMINLGEAWFYEHDRGAIVDSLLLRDGDVVRLDIKVTHSARQLSAERFNFCFRRIKAEYLPKPAKTTSTLFDEVLP